MARSRTLLSLAATALAAALSGCATLYTPANPALVAAARRDGPLAVYDALEALIEAGQDTPADREYAYRVVKDNHQDAAPEAFARAAVTGRLIQLKALRAAHLVAQVEREALRSRDLDPAFRDGAATRLLGTMYVAAPGTLLNYGDSERGLELLEGLTADRPDLLQNQLRLAEAYLALGDPEPASAPLCRCSAGRQGLRRDERVLLDRLLEQVGPLACPQAGAEIDVAAPSE
jgi:hypothetical protein